MYRRMSSPAELESAPFRRLLPSPWFVLAAISFLTIVAAQAATTRNLERRLFLLQNPARYLDGVYPLPRTELFAIILFIAGAAFFARATRSVQLDAPFLPLEKSTSQRPFSRGRAVLAACTIIVAAAAWIFLNIRLFNDHYYPSLVWLFWFTIVAFAAAVICLWWRSSIRLANDIRWWEAAVTVAAVVFFLVVNIRDIDSWIYAAIGDEYSFFALAKAMELGTVDANIFSQIGVYDQRPVGTTAIQALSMRIFGADSYGWRLATPIALAAAIPAVYLLGRELFDRQVAAFSTLVFATSHYLTSYAHTAYDNVFALVPFTWSVALAVIGLRRFSAPWMYAAGAVGGLGFYTFPTARMAPIVLILFIVTLGRRAWQPRLLLPFLGALLVTGLPLFATDRWDAISVARDRTVFGFTDSPTEGIATRILENIPRSLLGFNYNPIPAHVVPGSSFDLSFSSSAGHFVSGSLLDPVAAVLLVAGIGFALARMDKPGYRLLIVWFGVDIIFAGILSPYNRVGYDRLHLALPVVVLFVGIAMAVTVRFVSTDLLHGRLAPGYLSVALFVVMAPIFVYLNLQRFYIDSPKVVPTTEERMALGGIASPECVSAGRTLAIVREPVPLLDPAISAYGWDRDVTTRSLADAETAGDYDAFDCVVLVDVTNNTSAAAVAALAERLTTVFMFEPQRTLARGSPRFQATVFTRK